MRSAYDFLGNQCASPEQLDQQHRALTPNYCDPLSAEPSIIRLLFKNDTGQPTRRQTPLACSASCAWALPRNPQITAWLHLAAKPARARLDEFLSGRCPDRIRCLRRLVWAGRKIRSVWRLLLGRWLASSARFLAARLSMHSDGNEAWRRLALACFAYQP